MFEVEAQKCEPVVTLTSGQRVRTYLCSFKVIVFLPQTKVPPRFRSESSVLSRLLSTGVANSQPLYFRNREVDVSTSNKSLWIQLSASTLKEITLDSTQGVIYLRNVLV